MSLRELVESLIRANRCRTGSGFLICDDDAVRLLVEHSSLIFEHAILDVAKLYSLYDETGYRVEVVQLVKR
jgi:hypothetical protein